MNVTAISEEQAEMSGEEPKGRNPVEGSISFAVRIMAF
jgi:hypothetical protein